MTHYGTLKGVGVGPGDPELITFKAVNMLRSSTIIAYVVDNNGESFARQVAAKHFNPTARELPLYFSMSPCLEERMAARNKAAQQVQEMLSRGQDVTFITEGDPLLYSTFQHLLAAMPQDVKIEICPGISAMSAAAASARFPLAIEQEMVMIVPAETALGNIGKWLQSGYCLVLYKAARYLKRIATEIKAARLPCEAALIEHASCQNEVVMKKITDWEERQSPYFAIVLVRPHLKSEESE